MLNLLNLVLVSYCFFNIHKKKLETELAGRFRATTRFPKV